MSGRRIAVVGSGIMGSTLAYALTQRGHEVVVFEKGPDFPYPHEAPFVESVTYDFDDPARSLPRDLHHTTSSGDFVHSYDDATHVGGNGTVWTGLTPRIGPGDMKTRSRFGYGDDWPIDYDELEPYLCRAEEQLGVSGTDADNPWARPRSRPYPLPPFELTADDALLAARLARAGIHIHTTPQARTRLDYQGRPACMNYGECRMCPTGARYSPNVHLQRALATGRCRLLTESTVRRIVTDATGRARAVLYRPHRESSDREQAADVIVVAGAAIESARLLLLSKDARHPDGLGNTSGHVGRHLVFHHVWHGHMHFRERLFAGGVGFWTGQSDQFWNLPTRGRHGALKVEFPAHPWGGHEKEAARSTSLARAMEHFAIVPHCRQVGMHSESLTSEHKYVTLSKEADRFGDPVAHVHYDSCDFDRRTHEFGRQLFVTIAKATGAYEWEYAGVNDFGIVAHYMGTCRMGHAPADSVVNSAGAVHDTPGLFVAGLSNFVGSGGAANPTLNGVALALRTADFIAGQGDGG
jgi:glucose dehydrogenase